MPSFRIGANQYKALDGSTYNESISIEHETAKAILLKIVKRGREKTHWIPKSVCNFRSRPIIRVVEGKPQEVGESREVNVAEWWWEKEGSK